MIASFADEDTRRVFEGRWARHLPPDLARPAWRRLRALDGHETLASIGAIPGNRLEALRGRRQGQYSIRINDQWRICFHWRDGNAYEVEIVDYH